MKPAAPQGDPVLDPREFRNCLGQFATGVTVVTTVDGGEPVGVTANSFSSLSLEPPLILWSLKRTSRSFGAFRTSEHFCVNVLGAHQVDISQRFSSKANDKFANLMWSSGIGGVPVLDSALAVLECAVETLYEAGDHLLMIGRVERFSYEGGQALVFVQGRYSIAREHPDVFKASSTAASDPEIGDGEG